MEERKIFTKDEFTEEELNMLKLAFTLADSVVEVQRQGNYDVYASNILFDLKEKLGIYDLLNEL